MSEFMCPDLYVGVSMLCYALLDIGGREKEREREDACVVETSRVMSAFNFSFYFSKNLQFPRYKALYQLKAFYKKNRLL